MTSQKLKLLRARAALRFYEAHGRRPTDAELARLSRLCSKGAHASPHPLSVQKIHANA